MPYLNFSSHRTVPLQKSSFTIGSDPACDLPISDESVAPRHVILQSRGDGWQLATLNLRASVTVNDEPIQGLILLHDGDRIRVGQDVQFIWREADAPKQGPWLGLLLIFLAVIAGLSILFAAYRFDATYLDAIIPTALEPEIGIQSVAPAAVEENLLQPAGVSPAGHPVYRIALPVENDGP